MQDIAQNKLAIIFPGQGSQEKGMGRDLAESDPKLMEFWKIGEKVSGLALREVFWDGNEEDMAETSYQQPGLIVASITVWEVLKKWVAPSFAAGHSVGEYTALFASKVLSFEDVLKITSLRGRLMSEAGKCQAGSMGAVLKLGQETVQDIVDKVRSKSGEEICVANYNSPVQQVVSGKEEVIMQVAEQVKEKKGRFVKLPVSGAFHSSLMQEPAKELAGYMEKFEWKEARIPVHLNVTGSKEWDPRAILKNMQKQMVSPVLWEQIILNQWENGVRHWIEPGPKGVLTKMLSYILDGNGNGQDWQGSKVSCLSELEGLNLN